MARLVVIEGIQTGRSFRFSNDVTLGRSMDNTICLPDQQVSRYHARIRPHGPGFGLEDLHSANGTIVRGKVISPVTIYPLMDGDEIVLGSTRLQYFASDDTAALLAAGGEPFALTMLADDDEPSQVSVLLDASSIITRPEESATPLSDAVRRFQILCQVSLALGTITERDALLRRLLLYLFELFPMVDRGFVVFLDEDGETLRPAAVKSRQAISPASEVAFSRSIVHEVITHKRSILSQDARHDSRFGHQPSVLNLSIRSVMCAPLLIDEEVLGFIQVDSCQGLQKFTADDLLLLTGIGAQLAVAVKNSRLYDAIITANRDLQREIGERQRAERALREAHDALESRVQARTAALHHANEALRQEIEERKHVELELQKAKHAAEAASQAKSQFLRNITHELRTPLTVMLGNLPLLTCKDRLPSSQETVAIAGDIAGAATHLLTLINDLLDLSKAEAGKMSIHVNRVSASRVVNDVLHTLQGMIREKGLTATVEVDEVEVKADYVRLKQILLNVLSNAITYTERGGIRVVVVRDGDMVHFHVHDTGCGIAPGDLQRIFDAFVQIDEHITRAARGTGLGLAIVKKLAELHDGKVGVQSTVGQGSVFTVSIPVAE